MCMQSWFRRPLGDARRAGPTPWQEVQRVVHHVVLHPLCGLIPTPWMRAWSQRVCPAYDEADEGQAGPDPDDPYYRGLTPMWLLHHCIAHPLLVLWPRVGDPLHEWSGVRL